MNLEDGMFSTFYKFDDNDMKNIEEQYDLKIKENSFYKTKFVNHNGVDNYVNVYSNREEINKIFVETLDMILASVGQSYWGGSRAVS